MRQVVSLDWSRALAWRMRRQLLDPAGTEPVEGVVRRLGAVAAQLDAATELAIRARRARSEPGEVAIALAEGGVVSGTWSLARDRVAVAWFAEAGAPPEAAIDGEMVRLGTILGRPVEASVTVA